MKLTQEETYFLVDCAAQDGREPKKGERVVAERLRQKGLLTKMTPQSTKCPVYKITKTGDEIARKAVGEIGLSDEEVDSLEKRFALKIAVASNELIKEILDEHSVPRETRGTIVQEVIRTQVMEASVYAAITAAATMSEATQRPLMKAAHDFIREYTGAAGHELPEPLLRMFDWSNHE